MTMHGPTNVRFAVNRFYLSDVTIKHFT